MHGRAAIQTVSENFQTETNSLVEDSVKVKHKPLTISRQMFSFHTFKWMLMENEE